MNAYRVALILCRAVVVALWWSAGLRFLSAAIMVVVAQLNIAGLRSVPVTAMSGQSLINVLLLAIVAGFLQIFASSLAASMTGSATFEGDSISSRRTLDATERALGNAGGGLFLLFFGAASAIPGVVYGIFALLFGGIGSGIGVALLIFSVGRDLIPAVLQCLVGFVLAFLLGLRRVAKPQ